MSDLHLVDCSRLDLDATIEAIITIQPGIEHLQIENCFTDDDSPTQYDFLSRLSGLQSLYVCGIGLAADSLRFIGPQVYQISLKNCNVSGFQLASILACIGDREDGQGSREIDFCLHEDDYDERQKEVLEVCAPCLISEQALILL